MRLALSLCLLVATAARAAEPPRPQPAVPRARDLIQPEIARHLADAERATLKRLAEANAVPARFKTPLRQKAVTDPWGAMVELEKHGLDLAHAAGHGPGRLPQVFDRLTEFLGKTSADAPAVPRGELKSLDDHVRYITAVLDQAKALRDEACAKLSAKERQFMHEWPKTLIHEFGPQEALDDKTRPVLTSDRDFCEIMQTRVDWAKFSASVKTVLLLSDPAYLARLRQALELAAPVDATIDGVTGDVLYRKDTPHGLILFGGKGKNTYDLKQPVAFLADLGGDDTYRGLVASSFDADHPNAVVVDFAGNDSYEPAELGLATGRLGCGLLIDLAGRDAYTLAPGSGGTGFGGVGILCDVAGNDTYAGTQYTQGAAVAGIGLLIDFAGDDRYTSHGYALGLGGPVGVGAVIDRAGNDQYQCGHKFPSGYNASDAPNAKPGDPGYQYDCFGLGMGLGRRCYPFSKESEAFLLAGGVGIVLDLAGDDVYRSSNFSQACGYFFGVGLKLDLAGDDRHVGARYGQAAGAHYGLGLFIDYAGKDFHSSDGPTYTGGCAWDRSAFLFLDAGPEGDTYDLTRSGGLGRADIGSWGVFADLGGDDTYKLNDRPALATDAGLAVFLDAAGNDTYPKLPGDPLGNGKAIRDPKGELLLDR